MNFLKKSPDHAIKKIDDQEIFQENSGSHASTLYRRLKHSQGKLILESHKEKKDEKIEELLRE